MKYQVISLNFFPFYGGIDEVIANYIHVRQFMSKGAKAMDGKQFNIAAFNFVRETPFPDERKGEVFEIVNQVMDFAITHYEGFLIHHLDQELKEIPDKLRKDRELEFKHHLFWWIVFSVPLEKGKTTIFREFIQQHWTEWRYDHTLLQVLFSWAFISPGFYLVSVVLNDHELILKDISDGQVKPVTVYNEAFQTPEPGDLLSGLLLSYCDGSFSPIFDFLIIPKPKVTRFTQHLFSQFNQSIEPDFSSFIQPLYGKLLKRMIPFLNPSNKPSQFS